MAKEHEISDQRALDIVRQLPEAKAIAAADALAARRASLIEKLAATDARRPPASCFDSRAQFQVRRCGNFWNRSRDAGRNRWARFSHQRLKGTGQSAATIVSENIAKMWSRLPAPSRRRAVWFCNEQVEEQLDGYPAGPSTGALYMPAGSAGGNAYPILKGRPLLSVEQCPALGAPGDLILADMSHYTIVDSEIKTALSVHVRFGTDETQFRFVLRVDGSKAS